ncbi:MAG: response regulator [Nitrososphaeraceae archaeon]
MVRNNGNHESSYGHANVENLEQDQIKQSPSSTTIKTQNKRILIVDDNSDTVVTMRIGLERSDTTFQVFGYDNPVNALMDFKPNFYDLLLIDVNMPLMDGFELCKKLLQKDLNVRVCFMTSGEINMDAVREVHPLKSIGCFIKKPITIDALLKHIRAELE